MALLICAVIIGSAFPVVEMPNGPGGFLGRALTPKADTHVTVVGWGEGAAPASPAWLPCAPALWSDGRKTYIELVLRDESQVPFVLHVFRHMRSCARTIQRQRDDTYTQMMHTSDCLGLKLTLDCTMCMYICVQRSDTSTQTHTY